MEDKIILLKKELDETFDFFTIDLQNTKSLFDLDLLENKYLGKKSLIAQTLKNINDFSQEIKPIIGKTVNETRKNIEDGLKNLRSELNLLEFDKKLREEKFDLTLPGRNLFTGSKNILYSVIEEIQEIFIGLGYEIAEGPEVETDYYNFEALNHPPDHPARSLHDTFFIDEGILLRTQTSPVQIRYMEKHNPPVYIIAPGKVYRNDYDVTHTPMFTQIEGLAVDKNINFGNLKWTLETLAHSVFGKDRQVRLRPHYFPFTEPSAEVDVSCNICGGIGCRICSGTGWLEILGAGMVDPNLYKFVNYDPDKINGFAFGMGIERIAMLKYGIDDLRLFFENDIRFLKQF
jgi:phenylalanyl-tRNA synthetase alpha chain